MITKLNFEAPKTIPLSIEQIAFITEFADIEAENREATSQAFVSLIAGDHGSEVQTARQLPEVGDLMKHFGEVSFINIGGIAIDNRPIYSSYYGDTHTWHTDASLSDPYKFIGLACLAYPTEFASCKIELLRNSCAKFLSDYAEAGDWFEDEFEKFTPGFDETFSILNTSLEEHFGRDWLETAETGDREINKFVRVKDLSIEQTLPGVLAYGYTPSILHRKPAEPAVNERTFFRILSKDLTDGLSS